MGRPKILLTPENFARQAEVARERSSNYYHGNTEKIKERRKQELAESAKRQEKRARVIEAINNNIAIFGKELVLSKAGEIRHVLAFDFTLDEVIEIINT